MTQCIDEKFKDTPPVVTVERIQSILNTLGIEVEEIWHDSGIDHCYSLTVRIKNGYPSSNGKGVTKELARASAYAELIERLQQGLHYYKLQSLNHDPQMNLHSYAPDARYMTEQELIESGEWMDYLTEAYGSTLTRSRLAQQSKYFSGASKEGILTLPYYSLFENKYVYLPASFIDHVYNTNGCCAGNTIEEALVHAISEIFERKCKLDLLRKGTSAPKVPESVLSSFSKVKHILEEIRKTGIYEVDIYDISNGNGFPVVASRIINKETHGYVVNAAADPVLEIAIQRTLTELFQGRNINTLNSNRKNDILKNADDIPFSINSWNALESSSGLFAADFFADDLSSTGKCTEFHDNSNKTNKELLSYVLSLCKELKKPVYIRNYNYLGFTSYKVIIPGYSEASWPQLLDPISEYAMGDKLRGVFFNVKKASTEQLTLLLMYQKMIAGKIGKINNFSRIAGIPVRGIAKITLPSITFAFAAYKLKRYDEAIQHTTLISASKMLDIESRSYLSAVLMYIDLLKKRIDADKIRSIIYKFNCREYADRLYSLLDRGLTPYDDLLIRCDLSSCNTCAYGSSCTYQQERDLIRLIGNKYNHFSNGQDRMYFPKV